MEVVPRAACELFLALRIVSCEMGSERVWESNKCQDEAVLDGVGRQGAEKGRKGWKREGKVVNSRKVQDVSQRWV